MSLQSWQELVCIDCYAFDLKVYFSRFVVGEDFRSDWILPRWEICQILIIALTVSLTYYYLFGIIRSSSKDKRQFWQNDIWFEYKNKINLDFLCDIFVITVYHMWCQIWCSTWHHCWFRVHMRMSLLHEMKYAQMVDVRLMWDIWEVVVFLSNLMLCMRHMSWQWRQLRRCCHRLDMYQSHQYTHHGRRHSLV